MIYEDNRPHPVPGMVNNPEWRKSEARRADLYIAERERREDPEREPSRFAIALAILGCILIAASLFSGVFYV